MGGMSMSFLKGAAFIMLLVGGINSGFIGLFNVNILGMFGILYRPILILIGASAGYLIYLRFVKKEV
jgi:uncharacterized membrane protein YuzA (DUF378 family)